MAGVPLSAQAAVVRINANTLYAARWRVHPETHWADTSNFDGGGFETQVACLRKLTAEIEGWWDSNTDMFSAPLNINDGNTLTNVKLYVSGTSSAFWSIPVASVISVPMTADVHDILKYGPLVIKASGAFVYP